jgi:hypothetical protein
MLLIRQLVAAAALLALSACVGWMPGRHGNSEPQGIPGGDGRTMPQQRGVKGRTSGVSSKVVNGKRAPVTLIADDKTECVVPESKFKETAIGEKVLCGWASP